MQKRFIILSLLGHAVVLGAVGSGFPLFPSLPAPELQVTLTGNISTPRARDPQPSSRNVDHHEAQVPRQAPTLVSETPRRPIEPTTPAMRTNLVASQQPSQRAVQAPVNHLRSLLYARLRHYFIYPQLARRRGWQGKVFVGVRVDADGSVRPLRIVRSSGHGILDRHAFNTLKRIGSIPQARAWLHGQAYAFDLPITYRLIDG